MGFEILSFSATNVTLPSTDTWNTTVGRGIRPPANWSRLPGWQSFQGRRQRHFWQYRREFHCDGRAAGVNPGSVTISNSANSYTFTGSSIGGSGGLTMSGTADGGPHDGQ